MLVGWSDSFAGCEEIITVAKIRILADDADLSVTATLNQSKSAAELLHALPLESKAQTWGDEVYFSIPLNLTAEVAQAAVPSGAIAYWPPGSAFCIFFGQTPYSPVNVLGALDCDPNLFGKVQPGAIIRLEQAEAQE